MPPEKLPGDGEGLAGEQPPSQAAYVPSQCLEERRKGLLQGIYRDMHEASNFSNQAFEPLWDGYDVDGTLEPRNTIYAARMANPRGGAAGSKAGDREFLEAMDALLSYSRFREEAVDTLERFEARAYLLLPSGEVRELSAWPSRWRPETASGTHAGRLGPLRKERDLPTKGGRLLVVLRMSKGDGMCFAPPAAGGADPGAAALRPPVGHRLRPRLRLGAAARDAAGLRGPAASRSPRTSWGSDSTRAPCAVPSRGNNCTRRRAPTRPGYWSASACSARR